MKNTKNVSINQKKLRKYFKEIMIELFDYGTPVYYSVQVSSAKTILQEIHDYYVSNKGTIHLKQDHLKKLIEEFIYLSEKDITFNRYKKGFVQFDKFLKDCFGNKEISEKDFEKNVELLIIKIEPIIQLLNKTYFNNICAFIRELLTKDDIKPIDFKKIKKTCFYLSTEILRKGYTRNYIYNHIHGCFPDDQIYNNDIVPLFDGFLELFDETMKTFTVYLKVLADNKDVLDIFEEKYGLADINFIKPLNWKVEEFINQPKDINCIFICKGINALDPENAVRMFAEEIYGFLDIINYEYPRYKFSVFESAYCSGIKRTIPVLEGYLQKSSINFFKKKNEQIQKILQSDYIEESSKQKIKTLLKFYRYACDTSIPEHKLLNLWIGWEHIFSFNVFRNNHTWNNVCRFFPKISSLWYIEKVFLDIIYVQFNKNGNNGASIDKLISSDSKFKVANLYSILKEGGSKWNELLNLEFLTDDDLTKVKLYRLREKTKEPKKFIKEHKLKIEWELFRIYRTRNIIVHKGNINELGLPIEVLTFRLELFYKSLLEIILERLSCDNRFKSIEQLFISLENTYDFLISGQNHLSSVNEPIEIRCNIIRPTVLY